MPIISSRHVCTAIVIAGALLAARVAHPADLRVMTFNTKHGGEPPWNTADQIAEIVSEEPDVVLLQEVDISQIDEYVTGINRGLHSTGWHGEYARHCYEGRAPDCSHPTDEAVMILTRLPITDIEKRLIWAQDEYLAARGVLRPDQPLLYVGDRQPGAESSPPHRSGGCNPARVLRSSAARTRRASRCCAGRG